MKNIFGLSLTAALALPMAALAAAPSPHVRGTVSAISSNSITVHTDAGQDVTIPLTGTTHYVTITKSSLGAINQNSFIGTATKTVGAEQVALEVVVFPNSMRGTGEGHYGWDPLPDTTIPGGGTVNSSMTNGTVASSITRPKPKVSSSMTNGTVATATATGGTKELTVTYTGGTQTIMVPPTAPIVAIAPGAMSDVATGDAVVVTETKGSSPAAAAVAVGVNGTVPPM